MDDGQMIQADDDDGATSSDEEEPLIDDEQKDRKMGRRNTISLRKGSVDSTLSIIR